MSGIEIFVILFGLFLGYWGVSKFLTEQTPPPNDNARNHDETRDYDETENQDAPAAWHKTLHVASDASMEEIRRAYKTLMSQYHPDKVAALGDELKILAERKSKEITEAYRSALRARGG